MEARDLFLEGEKRSFVGKACFSVGDKEKICNVCWDQKRLRIFLYLLYFFEELEDLIKVEVSVDCWGCY